MKTAKQSIDLGYKGTKKRLNLRTALISLCMFAFVGTSAQTGTVTVKLRNASVKELFSAIEKQTSYRFSYRDAEIKGKGNVTISVTNRELKQLLEGELSKLGLKYAVSGNKIIVTPVAAAASAQPKKVTGKVVDANGDPVIGATIKEQGTANGTITDFDGIYPLDVADVRYQDAEENGLWYPFKKVGDMIQEGDILGEVRDYEGKVKDVSIAEFDGVLLYQTGTNQVLGNGPMVTYGRIVSPYDERKERIVNYWEKRSDSFLEQRRAELHCPLAKRWLEEIEKYLPKKALSPEKKIEDESKERKDAVAKIKEKETGNGKLKILDVGCGTGFFTILLAKQGHQVTGTDLTPDMITNSRILAKEEQVTCDFQVMDAEHLTFQDESFDVVISRNLTWTLPEAAQAYKEWSRVLKPGGLLLNFDANYGATNFAETSDLPENHAHNQLGNSLMQECEDIKRQLPISSYLRPAWDVEELGKTGMEQISIDLGLSRRVYKEKDEFYNPTPMFAIAAKKA